MKELGDLISANVVRLLREARRERGLTMEELADRAGVNRTYIGLLERGERRPTVAAATSIAAGLGISLADLLTLAERQGDQSDPRSPLSTPSAEAELVPKPPPRIVPRALLLASPNLEAATGLDGETVARSIEAAYHTFDLIDGQLIEQGADPIARLVELANLSAILGNLLAAGLAEAAGGSHRRSGPHKYPDLLANTPGLLNLEVKTALEGNRPKGHLPKPGAYLTFRYVLLDRAGGYTPGKSNRGDVASIWEVKFGVLGEEDFAVSSTERDSGKTAVIRTNAFNAMELVYFDSNLCPSPRLAIAYDRAWRGEG